MSKRVVLDTNVLVRFFSGDEEKKAKQAGKVLSEDKVVIPEVVLTELEYVMRGRIYGRSRKDMEEMFDFLMTKRNIKLNRESRLAMEIYKNYRKLSFADCLVVVHGKKWGEVMSFDKGLMRVVVE